MRWQWAKEKMKLIRQAQYERSHVRPPRPAAKSLYSALKSSLLSSGEPFSPLYQFNSRTHLWKVAICFVKSWQKAK